VFPSLLRALRLRNEKEREIEEKEINERPKEIEIEVKGNLHFWVSNFKGAIRFPLSISFLLL